MFRKKFIDQLKEKYKKGGTRLEGGVMLPIPNSNAVEFKGKTHEEGGIMLDEKTEVENNETMDKVIMKDGENKDYFFSSYLKKNGQSYADMHKEILSRGGSQKDINYLARMQEKAAKRNPNKIQSAKLGGVMQYKTGGPFKNKEEGNAFRAWVNETYPDYAEEIDLDNTGGYDNAHIMKAWDKYGETYTNKDIEEPVEFEGGTYTDPEGNIYEKGRTGEWRVRWNKATAEGLPEFGEVPQDLTGWETLQEGFDPSASGALTSYTGTMPKIEVPEEKTELTDDQQTLFDKIQGRAERKGDVPAIAAAAGIAQLGPAAYSLFHKQPPAEQAQYTRGFTNPIVAQMAKAPTLDRVNYNAERANNAAQMREIGNYIETSGGGPANIINKMMAYGKKQQGDMLIASAESKANMAISNQEAQMKNAVTLSNFQRAQQASQVNAQLQQGETARMDQINLANAAARQAVKDDEEFQKYQGVNTLGSNLAGLAGDLMSYKASERMARVMGSEGIYDRDAFRTIASKEIKKSGIPGICGGTSGIPCTDDMINKFITSQNKDKE
jgi:hypothetical protein